MKNSPPQTRLQNFTFTPVLAPNICIEGASPEKKLNVNIYDCF